MEAVLAINKGKPVRLKGKSPQINGGNYELSLVKYNIEGKLLSFTYKNEEYVYIDEIDYDEIDRNYYKKLIRRGYCKFLALSNYKKYKGQLNNFVKEENWFDGNFEFAQKGDLFKIEKVNIKKEETNNYKKYYIFTEYEFKITNLDIDFSDENQYPNVNTDINSSTYSKKTLIDFDTQYHWSEIEEGNFFTKNFKNKIDSLSMSSFAKETMYLGIIKICIRIYFTYKNILDKIAIENLQDILAYIRNIPAGTDPHNYIDNTNAGITTIIFTKTDKIIAHLLIDWGYKDLLNTKDLQLELNDDQFYDGLYRPFNNYYQALVNFYNNLYIKEENFLFNSPNTPAKDWTIDELNKQDNLRYNFFSAILPSSSISMLTPEERIKVIDTYIQLNGIHLPEEAEDNILKIIHSFYLFPTDGQKFLDFLLIKRDGERTNFEILFKGFDDDNIRQISPVVGFFANQKTNRRNFIWGLYEIWKKSNYDFRYIPTNTTPNSDGINPNAFFLSEKAKIYYQPNNDGNYFVTLEASYQLNSASYSQFKDIIETKFEIDKELKLEKIKITKITTHNSYHTNIDLDPSAHFNTQKEQMYFHLYQPINMVGYKEHDDLKEYLPQDPLVPAFVYYYCEEYDRLKDINAAWSTAIDVSLEIIFFFATGGVSIIKDLKYLKYVTKIGRALKATAATGETVMILRGTEVGFELFTVTTAICFNAANYIATTTDSETAKKLAKVFFWLTMLGAGATVFARIKATRAAKEIAANTPYYANLPNEVKPLINYLAGAEEVAVATFKANLQTKYPKLYSKFIELTNVGGTDYQRIFMQEFKDAESYFAKLDTAISDTNNVIAHWKSLYDKGIQDRKIIEVVTNNIKVKAITKYYNEPELRKILKQLDFETRWKFLDEFKNVDDLVFNEIKNKPIGINALMDVKILPKNSKDMFDVADMLAIIRAGMPTEHHIGCLMYKNRLEWYRSIKSFNVNIICEFITPVQLKGLYNNFSEFFSGVSPKIYNKFKGRNRLFVKVECYEDFNLVEPAIYENYLSGHIDEIDEIFEAVPNLKSRFVEPDDYNKFKEFARNAFDNKGKERFNDTEVKFLYNFFTEHYHKGNRFEIQMESVLYTCRSCQKYLQAAKNYAKSQGKVIDFKFISHHEAKEMRNVKKLIQ